MSLGLSDNFYILVHNGQIFAKIFAETKASDIISWEFPNIFGLGLWS